MKVTWTRNAIVELHGIHDTIARNSRAYAQGMVDRITKRTRTLVRFPRLGPQVPEYEDESIRELIEHPYRIIYRIQQQRIEILSVVHVARTLPTEPPGSTDR